MGLFWIVLYKCPRVHYHTCKIIKTVLHYCKCGIAFFITYLHQQNCLLCMYHEANRKQSKSIEVYCSINKYWEFTRRRYKGFFKHIREYKDNFTVEGKPKRSSYCRITPEKPILGGSDQWPGLRVPWGLVYRTLSPSDIKTQILRPSDNMIDVRVRD